MISSQAYPKSLSKNQSLARKEKICLKQEAQGKWPDSTMLIRASIISINKVVLLQKKRENLIMTTIMLRKLPSTLFHSSTTRTTFATVLSRKRKLLLPETVSSKNKIHSRDACYIRIRIQMTFTTLISMRIVSMTNLESMFQMNIGSVLKTDNNCKRLSLTRLKVTSKNSERKIGKRWAIRSQSIQKMSPKWLKILKSLKGNSIQRNLSTKVNVWLNIKTL